MGLIRVEGKHGPRYIDIDRVYYAGHDSMDELAVYLAGDAVPAEWHKTDPGYQSIIDALDARAGHRTPQPQPEPTDRERELLGALAHIEHALVHTPVILSTPDLAREQEQTINDLILYVRRFLIGR